MGIVATATIVPRNEYRKHRSDPEHYLFPKSLTYYWLDKAWYEIDIALQVEVPPARLAVRGNRAEFVAFEEFDEVYEAFASPAFVKKVKDQLSRIRDSHFLDHLKEQELDYAVRTKPEREYYLHYFHELKKAYKEASKKDCYLRSFLS